MLGYESIFLKSAQKTGIGSPEEGGRGVRENGWSNLNISEYFGKCLTCIPYIKKIIN